MYKPVDMETCYTYRLKKNTCTLKYYYILECDWYVSQNIRVQPLCHSNRFD